MGKNPPSHDPKLEAALDELDAALTADTISKIMEDLPETDEAVRDDPERLPPADRPGRRGKRRR